MIIGKRIDLFCLIGIILCMGIIIPFNLLIIGTDHPKQLTDLPQRSNGGIDSHQPSSEVSMCEAAAVDFSWSSWYNESDDDSDCKYDTIEIFYQFSNFTVTEWIRFQIEVEVYYWDLGWDHIDNDWEWFEVYVVPGETCKWSYTWRAWYDGNYSFSIGFYDDSTDELVIEDTISWIDASEFIFFNNWEKWIEESDEDGDSLTDTIEIGYSFNFTFSDRVDFDIRVSIYYWTGDWDYLDNEYEEFRDDVTAGEEYNVSFQFRAWYDGDYNFSIRIFDSYSGRYLIVDWVMWSGASLFTYFHNYTSWVDLSDEDGDGYEDTIWIEYSFNFTFSDWGDFSIWIQISYWTGYWEYIDSVSQRFQENVIAGEEYNVSLQWPVWYDGDYNFSIRIYDYDSGRYLIKEWFFWSDVCAFTLLDSWDSWIMKLDDDNDGCEDTIDLAYNLTFSYTGYVFLDIRMEIEYWNPTYGSWNMIYIDREYFEEAVTSGQHYTWSFQWHAQDSGKHTISVDIEERNYNIPLIEESFDWDAACAFNPIKEWENWSKEYDKDMDGCDDTIEIGFNLLFSITGPITLNLNAKIQYWNTEDNDWDLLESYYDKFLGDIEPNKWYYCSFEWSAWLAGDYEILIEISGEGGGTFIADTIQWKTACAFNPIKEWNSWFKEYDDDNDSCVDTIEIGYDISFTFSGETNLWLSIDIIHWNEESGSWELITEYGQHFQQQVTAGDWNTFSCRWSALKDGDFQFVISIWWETYWWGNIRLGTYRQIIAETIEWRDACHYKLIKNWDMWYNEYDEDSDGLIDTIEVGFDMTFSKSGFVSLDAIIRVQYWNEEHQDWQEVDTHLYEFFSEDVTEGSWYTMTISWSALYTGDYNISVVLADSSVYTTNTQVEEWLEWSDVTAYQGIEFEWKPIHEGYYYEERLDFIDIGYHFMFSHSGSLAFDIRVLVLYLEYATNTFEIKTISWDSFEANVTEGTWYKWGQNWDLTETEGYGVYFFITIFDGKARILDDKVSIYSYAGDDPHQILPIELTSFTTPTTKTEENTTPSQLDSSINIPAIFQLIGLGLVLFFIATVVIVVQRQQKA